MIKVEDVVPKDYFIAIAGRKEKEDGGSEQAVYYIGRHDLNERDPHAKLTDPHESDVIATFTETFGRSTTFTDYQSAARYLMSNEFIRGFHIDATNDGFNKKLDKTTIAIYSYGAQHVCNMEDINPMELL